MSIQTGITSSTCQALTIFIRDVLTRPAVTVSLCQSEIYHINVVLPLVESHKEIVRLDVTMQVQSRVDVLNPLNHLISQHKHCFKAKLAIAFSEKLLERTTKRIHYHDISFLVSSEIVNLWDADTIVEYLIYLLLIEQLGLRHRDGHLLLLFPVFGV